MAYSIAMARNEQVAGPVMASASARRWSGAMALLIVAAVATVSAAGVAGAERPVWKGAETFAPVRVGPNPARCGVFPRNLEAHFVGSGIDNNGGPYSVTASGCLDTEDNLLSDLEATDT